MKLSENLKMANAKVQAPKEATDQEQAAPVAKVVFNFKKTKLITIPLLKLELEKPVYVKLTSEFFAGKEVKGTGEKATMAPAILCHCINLENGEQMQFIVNSVVKGNLEEGYPEHAYVGKSFEIIKHDKRDGKKYNDFSIAEIEVE